MRIAVCGKGGSGKSTISALLAKQMSKTKNVLVLDIDESNYGLHSQLGLAAPKDLMEYFGEKKVLRKNKSLLPRQLNSGDLQPMITLQGSQRNSSPGFLKRGGVF